MPTPEDAPKASEKTTTPNPVQAPDANLDDDENVAEAASEDEAKDEAEKLDAMPYARYEKEEGDGD